MAQNIISIEEVVEIVKSISIINDQITATTPLLSSGIIDSLSLAEFVEMLNSRFQSNISVSDLGFDNADTAEQLTQLFQQK